MGILLPWAFLNLGAGESEPVTVPGLEYTLPENRAHWTLPDDRVHWTMPEED